MRDDASVLTLNDYGVWKVSTKSSHYIFDIRENNKAMAIRYPGQGIDDGSGTWETNSLQQDGEWYILWGLFCHIGESMWMDCFGEYNYRVSTPVVSIERVSNDRGFKGDMTEVPFAIK